MKPTLSRPLLIPLLIFTLAFTVRLVYLVQMRDNPTFSCPQMDADYHDRWARQIAAGDWVGREVFFRAPLYPYFLGALYAVYGPNYVQVRLVQFLLGALTCALICLIGFRAHGRAVGIAAGVRLPANPLTGAPGPAVAGPGLTWPSLEGVRTFGYALYFSTITFTATGYGDVVPSVGWGQAIAATETLAGVFLMATFLVCLARKFGLT